MLPYVRLPRHKVPVRDADTIYIEAETQDMLVRDTKLGGSLAKALGEGSEVKHPVVLMRGHGMVVTSNSIEMCVFCSVYTAQNAGIQSMALGLGGKVKLFTEKEAHDTGTSTGQGVAKPWPIWEEEVHGCSVSKNLV